MIVAESLKKRARCKKSVSYDVRNGIFKACRLNIQSVHIQIHTPSTYSIHIDENSSSEKNILLEKL